MNADVSRSRNEQRRGRIQPDKFCVSSGQEQQHVNTLLDVVVVVELVVVATIAVDEVNDRDTVVVTGICCCC